MDRRDFIKGLLALPFAPLAAKALPKTNPEYVDAPMEANALTTNPEQLPDFGPCDIPCETVTWGLDAELPEGWKWKYSSHPVRYRLEGEKFVRVLS